MQHPISKYKPIKPGSTEPLFRKCGKQEATNLEKISMLIYDRWGHIVFNSDSDKGNIEWDGKNLYGKDAAEGTYFYMIKASGKDGVNYDKKGTVSLYR